MSAVDPNIKQVRLVPSGGEDMSMEGGGQTRKRGTPGGRSRGGAAAAKTFKIGSITKEGGGSTSPGTMTQLAASRVPGAAAAAANAVGVDSTLTQKGAPVTGGGSSSSAASPAPLKVVLAAAKKKGKVVLAAAAAPKGGGAATTLAAGATSSSEVKANTGGGAASASAGKTRKHRGRARKIKVSMSSLSKKIHRAKTIRTKATDDSIEAIKKNLHKAGLIKADSKAPDAILRQMYADFLTLKSRAL